MDDLRHAGAERHITDLACTLVSLRHVQLVGLRYQELQLQAACICQYYESHLGTAYSIAKLAADFVLYVRTSKHDS